MATNYLEQLIAEWYEYKGYYVRRNLLVGKRVKGGFECELDVVTFNPKAKHLVHIEPSMDANSWAEPREKIPKEIYGWAQVHSGVVSRTRSAYRY